MIAHNPLIAFIPTKDAAHARSFYEEKLGLRFVSDDNFAIVMEANGTMVRVVRVGVHGLEEVAHAIVQVQRHAQHGRERTSQPWHALLVCFSCKSFFASEKMRKKACLTGRVSKTDRATRCDDGGLRSKGVHAHAAAVALQANGALHTCIAHLRGKCPHVSSRMRAARVFHLCLCV